MASDGTNVKFCLFFVFSPSNWGAESLLEQTICLKSAPKNCLVAVGHVKFSHVAREWACFTERYVVKFTASSVLTSSCLLQPLLSPGINLLLRIFSLIFCLTLSASYPGSGRHHTNSEPQKCGQYRLSGSYF